MASVYTQSQKDSAMRSCGGRVEVGWGGGGGKDDLQALKGLKSKED